MQLVITLRKEVEGPEQGLQLFELVKERLDDHPEVKVTAHVTNHFLTEEPPPGP